MAVNKANNLMYEHDKQFIVKIRGLSHILKYFSNGTH